jgi:hypothetical protein
VTRLALIALALTLVAAGCTSGNNGISQTGFDVRGEIDDRRVTGSRQLTDLRDIGQLRSLFNTRSSEPRLILLVSPT